VLNIYFLGFTSAPDALKNSAKTWEVGSYLFTFAYTIWFWFLPSKILPRGRYLLEQLDNKEGPLAAFNIGVAALLVLLITCYHVSLITPFRICPNFDQHACLYKFYTRLCDFQGACNIALLCITYIMFARIGKQIMENMDPSTPEKRALKAEIYTGFKYIDRPTAITFGILTIYAFCLGWINKYDGMEEFFSGAIAFELMFSNIAWATTKIA
jgi:hypothetical protein